MRKPKKKLFRRGTSQKYYSTPIKSKPKKIKTVRKVKHQSTEKHGITVSLPLFMFLIISLATISLIYAFYQLHLSVSFPSLALPQVQIPQISMPTLRLPNISLPDIRLPEIEIEFPSIPDIRPFFRDMAQTITQGLSLSTTLLARLFSYLYQLFIYIIQYLDPRPLLQKGYQYSVFFYPLLLQSIFWLWSVLDPLPGFVRELQIEYSTFYFLTIITLELLKLMYAGLILLFQAIMTFLTASQRFGSSVMQKIGEALYAVYVPTNKAFTTFLKYSTELLIYFYIYSRYVIVAIISSIKPALELFSFTFSSAGEFIKAVFG